MLVRPGIAAAGLRKVPVIDFFSAPYIKCSQVIGANWISAKADQVNSGRLVALPIEQNWE